MKGNVATSCDFRHIYQLGLVRLFSAPRVCTLKEPFRAMAAAVLAVQEQEQEGVELQFILPERIQTRDARVYTERVLILTSLIKPMEKETSSLITDLKDYLNARGEDVLLTTLGHIRLQTIRSRRLQVTKNLIKVKAFLNICFTSDTSVVTRRYTAIDRNFSRTDDEAHYDNGDDIY